MGCSNSVPARPPGPSLPGLDAAADASAAAAATRHGQAAAAPPRVKLVLLGDSGVGKSCLALRLARGEFDEASAVTVGAAFLSVSLAVPTAAASAPTPVRLDVWDTAGQERYAALAPLYYRGAAAAAVVYSVTDAASFARAGHWLRELAAHGGGRRGEGEGGGGRPMVIALLGNKTDLAGERVVSRAQGEAAAAAAGGLLFAETSAALDEGVRGAFEAIAAAVLSADGRSV